MVFLLPPMIYNYSAKSVKTKAQSIGQLVPDKCLTT